MDTSMLLPEIGVLNHRHFAALLAITGLALVPFAISHLMAGETRLFVLSFAGVTLMTVLLTWVAWRRVIAAPALVLIAGAGLTILVSISLQGMNGAFWAYPLVLVNYLIFALRPAIIGNALFLAVLTPVAIMALPGELHVRLLVTLAMVSIFSCVFSYAVHRGFASMDRLAQIDPLTGTWNRRHLHMRLPEPRNWLDRDGVTSSIIVIDIDHFKAINDAHGHAVGDDILAQVGHLLQTRTRDRDLVFRYGGEEFVLILPNTNEASAVRLAEELRDRIAGLDQRADRQVTISAGVAELRPNEDPEAWMARADAALYEAKAAGRNRVMVANRAGA